MPAYDLPAGSCRPGSGTQRCDEGGSSRHRLAGGGLDGSLIGPSRLVWAMLQAGVQAAWSARVGGTTEQKKPFGAARQAAE